jgi:hypothetical protein
VRFGEEQEIDIGSLVGSKGKTWVVGGVGSIELPQLFLVAINYPVAESWGGVVRAATCNTSKAQFKVRKIPVYCP